MNHYYQSVICQTKKLPNGIFFNMAITERLKQILSVKKISQAELALFGNVKPATVSRYLSGRQIDSDFVISLKEKLNISPTWLLTGEGDMFLASKKDSSILSIGGNVKMGKNNQIQSIIAHKGAVTIHDGDIISNDRKKPKDLKEIEEILEVLRKNPKKLKAIKDLLGL